MDHELEVGPANFVPLVVADVLGPGPALHVQQLARSHVVELEGGGETWELKSGSRVVSLSVNLTPDWLFIVCNQ